MIIGDFAYDRVYSSIIATDYDNGVLRIISSDGMWTHSSNDVLNYFI